MLEFWNWLNWLGTTDLSLTLQTTEWIIPVVQIIHIVSVCIVLSSVLVVGLRAWGTALTSVPLADVVRRFAPWLWVALVVLALTGTILIIAEPVRELYSLAFYVKMALILIGIAVSVYFQTHLRRNAAKWDAGQVPRSTVRSVTAFTLVVWLGVAVMGRWIAYDTVVFGDLSPHNHMPDVQAAETSLP